MIFWVKAEFNGNIYSVHHAEINDKKITGVASMYLNTSYLWGGRSVFGIDCSGFVQSIYKMINVPIFRDAINQVNQGKEISLEESQCSDLAFLKKMKNHSCGDVIGYKKNNSFLWQCKDRFDR